MEEGDAPRTSLDPNTTCSLFQWTGECKHGLKCRFLGSHSRTQENGELELLVDEERKARVAASETEAKPVSLRPVSLLAPYPTISDLAPLTTVGNLVCETVGFGVRIRSRNCATALPPPMCRLRRRHHLWRKYVPPNLLSRLYLLNACAQWVSQCPSSKPGKKNGLSSGDTPPRASSACRSRAASRSCSCPLRRS